jgi:hypothetical protein
MCSQWSSSAVNTKSSPDQTSDPAGTDGKLGSPDDEDARSISSQPTGKLSQEKERHEKGAGTLAKDIEIRRQTNERLYTAAEAYWSSIGESFWLHSLNSVVEGAHLLSLHAVTIPTRQEEVIAI